MAVTFSTATYVEAPPSAVFAGLVDLDSWKQWMPGLVSIEMLTPRPLGVGTEWLETRRMFGKDASEHFRITRWEPPHRLDLLIDGSKGTSGRGQYRFTYELMPERSGTNLELTGDVRMPGLWGLFGRLMIGSFKKACHKDLEALKTHLEARRSSGAA